MRYPNRRYGNPTEFRFYAMGVPLPVLARRLRRDERTVRDWLSERARVPWWVPEVMRLQRIEHDLRHRQMGLGALQARLGVVGADVITLARTDVKSRKMMCDMLIRRCRRFLALEVQAQIRDRSERHALDHAILWSTSTPARATAPVRIGLSVFMRTPQVRVCSFTLPLHTRHFPSPVRQRMPPHNCTGFHHWKPKLLKLQFQRAPNRLVKLHVNTASRQTRPVLGCAGRLNTRQSDSCPGPG